MDMTKGKTGGADNMHLMNDARAMVRVWGEGFLPYASQGRGKVIVEGYQDMQRDGCSACSASRVGIRFRPAPNEEENKWVPMVSRRSAVLEHLCSHINVRGEQHADEARERPEPEGAVPQREASAGEAGGGGPGLLREREGEGGRGAWR